jgi:hypothetical protein
MAGVFGSSGKTADPLGTIGVLTALIGAVFSLLLWIHYYQPDTMILGTYSAQIAADGQFADQLQLLAAVFGAMGVLAGIGGGLAGYGGASTVASLLLGIVALSYPVLGYLNIMQRYVPSPV